MGLGRNLLFLAHILLNIVGLAVSQNFFFAHSCYNETGSYYTANSIYQTNLNTLLSSLSSNTDRYGFNSSSLGNNPDRVNAIVLCRGDLDLETCRECIKNSTSELTQYCPNSKQAVVWYTHCMLRYSNKPINGVLSTDPNHWATGINASSVDLFNQALGTLLEKLTSQAASGGTLQKYAAGNEIGPNFQYIYGLAQCTPDLSKQNCTDCLRWIITNSIPVCCCGKRSMWYFTPSCHLRYESFNFINSIPAAAPPDSTPAVANPAVATPGKDDHTTRTVIMVVLAVGFVIVVCICILLRKRKQRKPRHILLKKRKQRKRRKSKRNVELFEGGYGISTVESLEYDFDTIQAATHNFSDANKLGQGGFGVVYKGKLENGQEIAVKRLSKESRQGELEFKNEATLVARLQHRNLVQLLGFCLEGTERLLIYEFMTNSSLDHSIFDPVKRAFLDWERRYKIIRGIARGLVYLHEDSRLRIIHRDLKASNVLLDTDMNPKISDFGMARLFVLDETQGSTSRIVGTYGYMAPEYVMHGQFSFKSDVFSYGVLVLEIVRGQKNNGFQNGENVESLLSHAWKSWREGSASNLVDPTLRASSSSMQEMMRCIHIGLLCVQENVVNRPTMASVILMLSSPSLTLYMPTEPSSFLHNRIDPEMPLLHEYNSGVSNSDSKSKYHSMSTNEDSIVELHPR